MSIPINGRGTLADRFNRKWNLEIKTGCWLWTGSKDRKGYGQIREAGPFGKTKLRIATRVSMELTGMTLTKEMCVCHKCDTPACVNPEHMFIGTHKENTQDMMIKGRNSLPPILLGERNPRARLTTDTVLAMRLDLVAGMSLRAAARKYNYDYTNVSAIKRRKIWKHV